MARPCKYLLLASLFSLAFPWHSFSQPASTCVHTLFASSGLIRSDMRVLLNVSNSVRAKVSLRAARETATDFCRALAGESSAELHDMTFKALLSLDSTRTIHPDDAGKPLSAIDYVEIEGPVCNMNGEIIANTKAEFWSTSHLARMNIDEKRADLGIVAIYTGSTAAGVYSSSSCGGRPTCNCLNWTSTRDEGDGGNTGRGCALDGRWSVGAWRGSSIVNGCLSNGTSHNSPCGALRPVYCLGRSGIIARLPEKHGF